MSDLPLPSRETGHGPVSRGTLWFGLLGGAFAWLAHLMLAYAIAEFGCVSPLKERTFLGINVVAWLLLAMSVATLLVAGAATLVAYRSTRRLGARLEPNGEGQTREPRDYVAITGLLTSGLFLLTILVESVPIFYYLHRC